MPPPFTNPWDQTFPADGAFVEQGASNLRQLRVDVQQRMAAISGADALKPNFAADPQPAQWAGILFFALDTARVYQFNGSAWVNVTSSIGGGGGGGGGNVSTVLDKNTTSITQSNSTTETTIFTTNLPPLGSTAVLRIRMNFVVDAWAASFQLIWRWNGGVILSATYVSGAGGTVGGTELYIANRTVTNAQQWNWYDITDISGQTGGGQSGAFVGEMAVDTSVGTTLTMSVLDSATGNRQTLNLWTVEML